MGGQEIGARLGGGGIWNAMGTAGKADKKLVQGKRRGQPRILPQTRMACLFHASSRHAGAYSLSANEARVWGGEIAMNFPG